MNILDIDPRNFPRDGFGPPLGGMPFSDYEKWISKMCEAMRDHLEKNPPPQHDGEPFTLFPNLKSQEGTQAS